MSQQISIEDAFPVYRERCSELFDENLLLRAQNASTERQLATAQEEVARLHAAAQESTAGPETVLGGPDLAAQPPFPLADGRV